MLEPMKNRYWIVVLALALFVALFVAPLRAAEDDGSKSRHACAGATWKGKTKRVDLTVRCNDDSSTIRGFITLVSGDKRIKIKLKPNRVTDTKLILVAPGIHVESDFQESKSTATATIKVDPPKVETGGIVVGDEVRLEIDVELNQSK